jgi:hypothetical protein
MLTLMDKYRGYILRVHDRDDSADPWGVGIGPYYKKMVADNP